MILNILNLNSILQIYLVYKINMTHIANNIDIDRSCTSESAQESLVIFRRYNRSCIHDGHPNHIEVLRHLFENTSEMRKRIVSQDILIFLLKYGYHTLNCIIEQWREENMSSWDICLFLKDIYFLLNNQIPEELLLIIERTVQELDANFYETVWN